MDRALVEQIVLNLVTNARDAIEGPGRIDVELERVELPPQHVRLRVSDSGSGMDSEVLAQVFEPFFTTKSQGRGTGLGLAAVEGAVSQLKGQIRASSEVGKGSRFDVLLPTREPGNATEPRPSPSLKTGDLNVLVVEDDARVRSVTSTLLKRAGHRVESAESGEDALRFLGEAPFDIVLSDVSMPGMGGVALARAIRRRWPGTVIVLTSGHPPSEGIDDACCYFIPKPLQLERLLSLLAGLAPQASKVS